MAPAPAARAPLARAQSDRQRAAGQAAEQESIYHVNVGDYGAGLPPAGPTVRTYPTAAQPTSPTGAAPKRRMHADSSQVGVPDAAGICVSMSFSSSEVHRSSQSRHGMAFTMSCPSVATPPCASQ